MAFGAAHLRERGRAPARPSPATRSRRPTARGGAGPVRRRRSASVSGSIDEGRFDRVGDDFDRILVEQRRGLLGNGAGRVRIGAVDHAREQQWSGRRQRVGRVGDRLAHRGGVGVTLARDRSRRCGRRRAPDGPSCSGAIERTLRPRAVNVPSVVSAANGMRPVTASTMTSASEYMSERPSSCTPVACSGDA